MLEKKGTVRIIWALWYKKEQRPLTGVAIWISFEQKLKSKYTRILGLLK